MPEIERKWVPGEVPDQIADAVRATPMRQGYVALDAGRTCRVRHQGDRFVLAVKGGHGLTRAEVEVDLTAAQFDELWPLTEGRRVEKVRHDVPLDDGLTAEVDRFAGALEGLVLVEVEFPDEDRARSFMAPGWFGREVTGRPGWSNASLSIHGVPGDV